MQNGFELTLKGDNFAGVIAQARALCSRSRQGTSFSSATTGNGNGRTKSKTRSGTGRYRRKFLDDVAEAVEETEELPSDDTEVIEQVEEPATKPAKTATAKKLTKNDVDNAAIAHAQEKRPPCNDENFSDEILKRNQFFEIKEANWPLVIKALAV